MRWLVLSWLFLFFGHGGITARADCDPPKPTPPSSRGTFSAHNGNVYDGADKIQLRGVNWFGLETELLKLHGLWTGRSVESFVDQFLGLGFNAWRIPVAPEAIGGQELVKFLEVAKSRKMYVLLDLHKCKVWSSHMDKGGPGTAGSCKDYTEDKWTADLVRLAKIAAAFPNVVGIDLFNEPYALKWSQWARMSERAGAAVLKANPALLIFVEGVANESDNGGYSVFWGENFVEFGKDPVKLPVDKLVISPHVYGPSVAGQDYFFKAQFPGNMAGIWDKHFGYLSKDQTIVFGEFGGRYEGVDKIWQDTFVGYAKSKGLRNYFYWSLNPNSGDTGGVLLDDWKTVNEAKLSLLRRL